MTEKKRREIPNRLADEKSPYLLQHAQNPVHWFSWSDRAFDIARREDKPIFLSIGYATCHWCHVMAHESFEDEAVARLMNETFISIKVDREERPDVDSVYMSVCQMMTGSGGWPLTIVMTPDKRPFFAATYIPKTTRFGRSGMLDLIPGIAHLWQTERPKIETSAQEITHALAAAVVGEGTDAPAPGEEALLLAFRQLSATFDSHYGGFGNGIKFPTPHQLNFLMRYHRRTGDAEALHMVEKTLTAMRQGGIYDHVGFGFHRYATDPKWHIPHFEKMLYDQALLLMAYLEAFQATGKAVYADTAREIITYVQRDMTSPQGGFYSAEDADSEGQEGKFYGWGRAEVSAALGEADADLVSDAYGVTEQGNFSEGDESAGKINILYRAEDPDTLAARRDLDGAALRTNLAAALRKLFQLRAERIRPLRDDKVLTDWNGLMIGALAQAGRILDDPVYTAAAERATRFLMQHLTDERGRLMHRYRDGQAGLQAHLDDYAFFVFGLIELYQASFAPRHLAEALRLTDLMLQHFRDPKGGALFLSADDTETVLLRVKDLHDGALPAGNSMAMANLLKLSKMTGRTDLADRAEEIAKAYGAGAARSPINHTLFLSSLDFAIGPSVEVVIAGDPSSDDTRAMLGSLNRAHLPNKVVLLREDRTKKSLSDIAPFTAHQPMVSHRATAYVCVSQSCALPTNDPDEMLAIIREKLLSANQRTGHGGWNSKPFASS